METEFLERCLFTIGIWIIPSFKVTMIVFDYVSGFDRNVTSSVDPAWNLAPDMLLSLIEISLLKEP